MNNTCKDCDGFNLCIFAQDETITNCLKKQTKIKDLEQKIEELKKQIKELKK